MTDSLVRTLIADLTAAGYVATFDPTGGGCYAVHVDLGDGVIVGVTGTDVFYAADLDSDDDVDPDQWTPILYVDGEQVGDVLGGTWLITTAELVALLRAHWPADGTCPDCGSANVSTPDSADQMVDCHACGAAWTDERCTVCHGLNSAGDEQGHGQTDDGRWLPLCSVGCTTHHYNHPEGA